MAKSKFTIYSGSSAQKAGEGLMNEVSRKANVSDKSAIQQLPYEQLIENKLNEEMSMSDIEALKDSIADVGLQQPLVVTRDGADRYRILSGHRRYRALRELLTEGRISYNLFPCVVKDFDRIELPISDEAKEKYAIATTNIENRDQTFSDRIALLRMMIDVYNELKAVRSEETINGRRAFLAKRLKLSGTQIQDLLFIDKNIVPEVRGLLDDGQITLATALELAHLPAEQQTAALAKAQEQKTALKTVAKQDAAAAKQEAEAQAAEKRAAEAEVSRVALETAAWRMNQIAEKTDFEKLSERKRTAYAGYMARIQTLLAKMEKDLYKKKKSRRN